jgi:hypothetical protein
MAAVQTDHTNHTNAGAPPAQASRARGMPEVLAGSTEARPGIITTEFWLTIAAAAAVVIVSYLDDALEVERGWTLGIVLVAAYVVSRGIAKAGSSERFIGLRDRD